METGIEFVQIQFPCHHPFIISPHFPLSVCVKQGMTSVFIPPPPTPTLSFFSTPPILIFIAVHHFLITHPCNYPTLSGSLFSSYHPTASPPCNTTPVFYPISSTTIKMQLPIFHFPLSLSCLFFSLSVIFFSLSVTFTLSGTLQVHIAIFSIC